MDDIGDEGAQFMRFACERIPNAVVDMFLRRIERRAQEGYRSGSWPVPFNALHDTFTALAGTDRHRELLCRIRDFSLDKEALALDWLARLYRDVSLQYGPTGVEVLSDWLLNGNQRQLETATDLLREAPTNFVFNHLEFVGRVLDRAAGFGDDCLGTVARAFFTITVYGSRSGLPGQPFPQGIALGERCQELLGTLPPGGTTYRLIRDVLSAAEQNIKTATQEQEDDEE